MGYIGVLQLQHCTANVPGLDFSIYLFSLIQFMNLLVPSPCVTQPYNTYLGLGRPPLYSVFIRMIYSLQDVLHLRQLHANVRQFLAGLFHVGAIISTQWFLKTILQKKKNKEKHKTYTAICKFVTGSKGFPQV